MTKLPVIVGFGGFNAAGRSSFHQSYQRMVYESLSLAKRQETIIGLATMMGRLRCVDGCYQDEFGKALSPEALMTQCEKDVLDNTLIRQIGPQYFDVNQVPAHQRVPMSQINSQQLSFKLPKRHLPSVLPSGWQVADCDSLHVQVLVEGDSDIKLPSHYVLAVQTAGQLPDGFQPDNLYSSRFHPRGLQLAITGASDAVHSMGIEWQAVLQHLAPDQVGVYSTSIMGQLDDCGTGGLLKARLNAGRVSTKQLALGLNSMPADFVNAYVLGSMGVTGSISGACASFLYNLHAGMQDIRSGRRRVVVVGSSEAPITPEIIEGYATMGALATDEKLRKLDNAMKPDYRRASRPFADNCGFTIAESTQHVVLMDDALAIELGATIYGSVGDIFINADGYKKSISAPGPGNYVTFAKAVASAAHLLGEETIRQHSFIQAHGSSTPQNRVTESEIFHRIAKVFGIHQWPVAAIKAFVGHSLAPASGDQLVNTLGVFALGILPGIKTIDQVADDVLQERLQISSTDTFLESPEVAFLNSKGFGGNNATAFIISPQRTQLMLSKRYGKQAMLLYEQRCEKTQQSAEDYQQAALRGDFRVRYHFGRNMIDDKAIELDKYHIRVPGFGQSIDLSNENLYKDMV